MTTMKHMLSGYSDKKIKQCITSVGGQVNYQVKYNGKPSKSYLIPHTTIPEHILYQWNQCKRIHIYVHANISIMLIVGKEADVDDKDIGEQLYKKIVAGCRKRVMYQQFVINSNEGNYGL